VDLEPHALPSGGVGMGPMDAQRTPHRLDRLTSQARSVRGHFSRRAMHASGDSPWHSSAKHHILEACFFRMTPFRSMLLTLQSGLQRLTPRAQSVPAYAQGLRLSSIVLARRTRIPTKQKRRSTGPGAKRPLDPQRPEKNGSRMAPAATNFRAPSECHGYRRPG
jgi:hypothetical protein